jgi:hypothetical protein
MTDLTITLLPGGGFAVRLDGVEAAPYDKEEVILLVARFLYANSN